MAASADGTSGNFLLHRGYEVNGATNLFGNVEVGEPAVLTNLLVSGTSTLSSNTTIGGNVAVGTAVARKIFIINGTSAMMLHLVETLLLEQ